MRFNCTHPELVSMQGYSACKMNCVTASGLIDAECWS